MLWVVVCGVSFYLWIRHGLRIDMMARGPEQDAAAFEFTQTTMKIAMPATFVALVAGVIFVWRRPGPKQ